MKKLDFIVYLRCLAVLLVVLGHALCIYSDSWGSHVPKIDYELWSQIKRLIYMVHLPIFTIISGYIFIYIRKAGGYDSFWNFLSKKIKRLLIPLLVWSFIECTIDFDCNYRLIFSAPLHLWYLKFLFITFIVTYIYNKWLLKFPWIIALLVLCIEIKKIVLPDLFPTFFGYYSWFLIGVGLHEITCRVKIKKIYVYILLLFSLVICATAFIITGKAGISSMLFVISIFLLFEATDFPPISRWVNSIDKSSMGIYLIHHPIIWNFVATDFGRQFMSNYPLVAPLLLTVIVFGISWLISALLLKSKYLKYII